MKEKFQNDVIGLPRLITVFIITALLMYSAFLIQNCRTVEHNPSPIKSEEVVQNNVEIPKIKEKIAVSQKPCTITVIGTGKISFIPSTINIEMILSSEDEKQAEALSKNSTQRENFINLLQSMGVSENDIKDIEHLTFPVPKFESITSNRNKKSVLAGYRVIQLIIVKIKDRNIEKLGEILEKTEVLGIEIKNVYFEDNEKSEKLVRIASVLAFRDAQKTAEKIAHETGRAKVEMEDYKHLSRKIPEPIHWSIKDREVAGVPSAVFEGGADEIIVEVLVTFTAQ